jgi:hypothetical protein
MKIRQKRTQLIQWHTTSDRSEMKTTAAASALAAAGLIYKTHHKNC